VADVVTVDICAPEGSAHWAEVLAEDLAEAFPLTSGFRAEGAAVLCDQVDPTNLDRVRMFARGWCEAMRRM
jgi:hypothetical protein